MKLYSSFHGYDKQMYKDIYNYSKYKSHRLRIGTDSKGRKFLAVFLRQKG